MRTNRDIKILFGISIQFFLLAFPLIKTIDFMQNDDWVYYKTTADFMKGVIQLDPYIGPTFYLQGFMGALWAYFFTLETLPILTLIITVLNFFIFATILIKFFKQSWLTATIIGSIYLFNPLNVYTAIGYMTTQYFMFFLLLSVFTFLLFEKNQKYVYLFLTLFLSFLGLLIRQVSLAIPLSMAIYFTLKKDFKKTLLSIISSIFFGVIYNFLIPLTPRIREVGLQLHHFKEIKYTYSLIYGILIILAAFLLPFIISVFLEKSQLKTVITQKKKLCAFLIISIFLFITLNKLFMPQEISWGEFPYFENTFERTGFYPRGVSGTKYHFMGSYDLYRFWDLAAKIGVAVLLSYILLFQRKFLNFHFIFIVVYLLLMVTVETFYDRYILILIPPAIMYLLSIQKIEFNLGQMIVKILFGFFLMFLSYQFAMDFILVNKYIWNKAKEISKSKNIPEKRILATNAWKLNYINDERDYTYNFSYDSQVINETYRCCYYLVEVNEINYPLNIFVNPKIYLYQARSFSSTIEKQDN